MAERSTTGFVLGAAALVAVIIGSGFAINILTQPLRVISKTVDADNMIGNYEWFKTQYQDYTATVKKANNARLAADAFGKSAGDRSTWTFDDKQEAARLASVQLGLENQATAIAAAYNARSAMSNRSIFKGSDLPDRIDP